ncbi:MAG: hypothetical protein AAGM38_18670, partial [Pseudomonadota bacterium]
LSEDVFTVAMILFGVLQPDFEGGYRFGRGLSISGPYTRILAREPGETLGDVRLILASTPSWLITLDPEHIGALDAGGALLATTPDRLMQTIMTRGQPDQIDGEAVIRDGGVWMFLKPPAGARRP